MPTLLSINNYYYRRGGAEAVFLGHNQLFTDIGWHVVPFAMQHDNNLDTPWSQFFVTEIEYSAQYSLWQKLVRIPKVIYSLEARRKLDRLLDKVEPDIAHAHNIYHHISPSILGALKKRRVPTVLTLHDLKLACPAYKMLTHDGICERCKDGKLYNVVIHKCVKESLALSTIAFMESALHYVLRTYVNNVDRFVVPSRFYLDKMVEWGFDRTRFVHIPNFVDVKSYKPEFQLGERFLYFGRLAPEKGLKTLVKAASLAKVPVWIVGSGSGEGELRRLARDLGAIITFVGHLTGEALHQAIRSARAVVLPSEWYENAPMSVMESYALGVPVVGAAIGGIRELIREGETGLMFQSGSIEDLARALRQIADLSDDRIAEMGRSGQRWMESEYTADHYRDRLLRLYADIGVTGLKQVSPLRY